MSFLSKITRNPSSLRLGGILILFGAIYSLISLVNHHVFRSYAQDLGAYTNALFDYRNLQWNDCSTFLETPQNLLADHFDLYLPLFSPLSWIWGTETLLIVQILSLLVGGLGVYRCLKILPGTAHLATWGMVHFLLFFGLFSAVAYDYHSNVVATMLVPWFFYLVFSRRWGWAVLVFALMLVAKENMSIWLAFVALGLGWELRNDRVAWIRMLAFAGAALVYFYGITQVVMPGLSAAGHYPHFDYSLLGPDPISAVKGLFTQPIEVFQALFTNHRDDPTGDYVKLEVWLFVAFSGGVLLLRKPHFLLMLLPIFLQKLLHDQVSMWSSVGQYSVEFAPVITIGAFLVLAKVTAVKWQRIGLVLVMIAVAGVTFRLMDNSVYIQDRSRIRFYQARHFERHYDPAPVQEVLGQIPADKAVSAQSPFHPHLSLRDNCYQFPIVRDAEVLVLSRVEAHWPLDTATFHQTLDSLEASPEWQRAPNTPEHLLILHRQGNSSQ